MNADLARLALDDAKALYLDQQLSADYLVNLAILMALTNLMEQLQVLIELQQAKTPVSPLLAASKPCPICHEIHDA